MLYQIIFSRGVNCDVDERHLEVDTSTVDVTDLWGDTLYCFKVCSCNAANCGAYNTLYGTTHIGGTFGDSLHPVQCIH